HTIGAIAFGLGTATVTNLTAFATAAVVNQLTGAFGYRNTLDSFDTTSRTVNFTFDDGGNTGGGALPSNTIAQTINLTALNDAPVNLVPAAGQTVASNATLTFQSGTNEISISDVDAAGGNETV